MRVLVVAATVLMAVPAFAQMTYEERAALAADPVWQNRVGIAAQQQAVVVHGESPTLCCQISTQEALVYRAGKQTLCDLTFPAGKPGAPAYVLDHSTARHAQRAMIAGQVLNQPAEWARRMAGIVASDQCVLKGDTFTDLQLQSYMVRLWDLYALSPQMAATPTEAPAANPQVVSPAVSLPPPGVPR